MVPRRLIAAVAASLICLTGCQAEAGSVSYSTAPSTADDAIASAPEALSTPVAEPTVAPESLYERTSRELLQVRSSQGTTAALEELQRRIDRDPSLPGICHAIAHDLGHAALEAAEGNVGKALVASDDVCGGGFTHGIIEDALGKSKHPARDLLRICAPELTGSCFHGVGHGVMFATGMDVDKSMVLCDLAPTSRLSARCGEGVFMQLFSADGAGGHTARSSGVIPTLDDARTLCGRIRSPYSGNCWFYSPTLWLAQYPDDFTGAINWCRQGTGAQVCAKGVGSRTIKYHPEDPTIGAKVCATADRLTDACLAGMGSYWSVHHEGKRPPGDVCGRLGDRVLERRCLAVT